MSCKVLEPPWASHVWVALAVGQRAGQNLDPAAAMFIKGESGEV